MQFNRPVSLELRLLLKFSRRKIQRDDEARGFFRIVKTKFILVKIAVMKIQPHYRLSIAAAALFGLSTLASARPMDFNEVSLLVRVREPESSITQEVQQRKLVHSLTPQQENTLKSQGASDSLIRSLRDSNAVVSKEEAAAFESQRDQQTKARIAKDADESNAAESVRVFDVALGHPINLSQWGGADYELAFYSYRCAGEDIFEPALIDNVRTMTTVYRSITDKSESEAFAGNSFRRQRFLSVDNDGHRFTPYDGRRDLKDDRFDFRDTVSVSSYATSRPLAIDWSSPVVIKGVPYALYPVYSAGGVSLYYISGNSTSVRLAVSTVRM